MCSQVMRAAHLQPQQLLRHTFHTLAGCQLEACTSCGRCVAGCGRMFLQAVLGSANSVLLSAGFQQLFSFFVKVAAVCAADVNATGPAGVI